MALALKADHFRKGSKPVKLTPSRCFPFRLQKPTYRRPPDEQSPRAWSRRGSAPSPPPASAWPARGRGGQKFEVIDLLSSDRGLKRDAREEEINVAHPIVRHLWPVPKIGVRCIPPRAANGWGR